jgi:hypothetical protein
MNILERYLTLELSKAEAEVTALELQIDHLQFVKRQAQKRVAAIREERELLVEDTKGRLETVYFTRSF